MEGKKFRDNLTPYYQYALIPVNVSAILPVTRLVPVVELLVLLRSLASSMVMSNPFITDKVYKNLYLNWSLPNVISKYHNFLNYNTVKIWLIIIMLKK